MTHNNTTKEYTETYGKFKYTIELPTDFCITEDFETSIEEQAINRITYLAKNGYISGDFNVYYYEEDTQNEYEFRGGFLKGIIYFHVMNDINNYNVLAFSIKF